MSKAKDLYTIQEFAKLTALTPHTLRYYEKIGLIYGVIDDKLGNRNFTNVLRDKNGNRIYTQQNLDWINLLQKLKITGMNLKQIKYYVELITQGNNTLTIRLELLAQHQIHIKKLIEEYQEILVHLDKKMNLYKKMIKDLKHI